MPAVTNPQELGPDLDRAERVARFAAHGFGWLGQLIDERELARLRGLYDDIVRAHMSLSPAEMTGVVALHERPLLVIYPSKAEIAQLREGPLYARATGLVAELLEVDPARVIGGWRLFFKPVAYAETKWHQDAAYRPPPHETVSVWLPIDDANAQTSCMSYLGGTHIGRQVQPHVFEGDHLVAPGVDGAAATACPIPAGGATLHHSCTVHRSGPNNSDRPRRTLGIVCRTKASP